MLRTQLAAFACMTAFLASGAHAADLYGSVGGARFELEPLDSKLAVVQGRIGAKFMPYLGVEAEAATGFADDTWHVPYAPYQAQVTTELNYQVAGYAVGFLPLTEKAELFARVGYGKTRIDRDVLIDGEHGSANESLDGWSYGAGGQYFFDGQNGVRLDFTRHDLDDENIDAWAVGYVRRF